MTCDQSCRALSLLLYHSKSILICTFGVGMGLRSIVSYFVALNHGIICSLFGVLGKAVDEIIVIGSGNATAGIDNGSQRTALPPLVWGRFPRLRGKCLQSGQKGGRQGVGEQ